ncbi:MAG: cyclase family protein [Xanthobacteraceae bacterium]|nr:cyclase family protein [Xanthobacteraceae bacterium]
MRIVDLSVALDHVDVGPSAHRPKITYKNHDETWAGFSQYFPGVPTSVMPDNKAWASEEVSLITHCGTHMDAPWHYLRWPRLSEQIFRVVKWSLCRG